MMVAAAAAMMTALAVTYLMVTGYGSELWSMLYELRYTILVHYMIISYIIVISIWGASVYAATMRRDAYGSRDARGTAVGIVGGILFTAFVWYEAFNLILDGYIIPYAVLAVAWAALTLGRVPGLGGKAGFMTGLFLCWLLTLLLFADLYFEQYMFSWMQVW